MATRLVVRLVESVTKARAMVELVLVPVLAVEVMAVGLVLAVVRVTERAKAQAVELARVSAVELARAQAVELAHQPHSCVTH